MRAGDVGVCDCLGRDGGNIRSLQPFFQCFLQGRVAALLGKFQVAGNAFQGLGFIDLGFGFCKSLVGKCEFFCERFNLCWRHGVVDGHQVFVR